MSSARCGRGKPRCDRRQQHVPDRVAERIVDVLEAVEVEEQDGDLAAVAARACDRLSDAVREQRPVGQPGQGVMMRHVHDALVRQVALGDLRLEPRIHARKIHGPLADPLLERLLHLVQCVLGRDPLVMLAADHAIGVAGDQQQRAVEQGKNRQHDRNRDPLGIVDSGNRG